MIDPLDSCIGLEVGRSGDKERASSGARNARGNEVFEVDSLNSTVGCDAGFETCTKRSKAP